jgi:oxygen-independent coproporphyrinogen-3 oxidase
MKTGLYIHVPFCRRRCHFCAFYLQIHRDDRAQAYLSALQQEIRLHLDAGTLAHRPLQTAYFGGGTPTTLTPDQLAQVLRWVQSAFSFSSHPEITVEAHPDTVTEDGLEQLHAAGFTRISLGLQSTEVHERDQIGRHAGERPIGDIVAAAREAGFQSVNIDLMYGLPGQTPAHWMTTLTAVLAAAPDHISCYALTIEEHSQLHLDLRRGSFPPPDLDLQNELEELATSRLTFAGYERYEISNFARPGHASRHNSLYWQGDEYLGLGPSAQSYLNGIRFGNIADLRRYEQYVAAGTLPITEADQLDAEQRRREAVIFGLRMTRGIPIQLLHEPRPDREWSARVEQLMRDGLLATEGNRMKLTARGRALCDSVAVTLL